MTFDDKLDKILLTHGAEQGELHYSLKQAIKDLVLIDVVGEDLLWDDIMTPELYESFDNYRNALMKGLDMVNSRLNSQRLIINGKESNNE